MFGFQVIVRNIVIKLYNHQKSFFSVKISTIQPSGKIQSAKITENVMYDEREIGLLYMETRKLNF